MKSNKTGSAAIVNLISIIITVIIIVIVGIVYYFFFSPDELELEEVKYTKIDINDYEVDKEFEKGLDRVVDFNYTDDELDMHRDLKDYYQGREDPFTQSEDRNSGIELDGERDKITNSRPDLAPSIDEEEEFDVNSDETSNESSDNSTNHNNNNTPNQGSTILDF